jgi:hypothetical protein
VVDVLAIVWSRDGRSESEPSIDDIDMLLLGRCCGGGGGGRSRITF